MLESNPWQSYVEPREPDKDAKAEAEAENEVVAAAAERERALAQMTEGDYQLQVRVVEGRDLAARDLSGLSDPYVELKCFGQSRRTASKRQQNAPVWDEQLIIQVRTAAESTTSPRHPRATTEGVRAHLQTSARLLSRRRNYPKRRSPRVRSRSRRTMQMRWVATSSAPSL